MSTNTVSIKILDKEYQVACPPEEQAALTQAGQFLDQKMRGIRTSGKVIGLERIAVMAALNISYEMLQAKQNATPTEEETQVAERIGDKIEQTLQRCRQLDIS
ncbi:Cell division protein ZapA [Zhongshania aliphaticivorans]|uniref:Cell division protein ZapA n=1 Tax=Zhongshania aliphaticivorans TaxID=1470434 RepID=A0A5S9MSR3_9GAMM|nr:cell division protein ZapA [Zhongshania aliphaticivorans]CAA0079866.1 Cell division protein ZapA [Zhongshania aliphaticivorans]CAA0085987.1 Cell division protein ZapA [Zhongshania aliphaticivorans]